MKLNLVLSLLQHIFIYDFIKVNFHIVLKGKNFDILKEMFAKEIIIIMKSHDTNLRLESWLLIPE